MDRQQTVSNMSIREKIELCSGKDFWHTKAMPQHDLPAMMMCDGPHGLRKQPEDADMLGINQSLPATSFPTAVLTACSWDEELIGEMGAAIAREAKAGGVGMVLGPGANIKRNPLCGRNFEYFSEDPFLTGKMAAAWIRGAEAEGVSASLKHFACNSQEYKRFSSDSVIDERTLREIYLTGFEMAVKEGRPGTVMSAYNMINGEYCSDSRRLLTDILRRECGFDGLVVTDWGGMGNRVKGFAAGCDLMMPGGSAYMENDAAKAVEAGVLDAADVDRSALRVCRLVDRAVKTVADAAPADMEAHYQLARRVAAQSAVLLKNQDDILPLKDPRSVAFIGYMAERQRYQGAGSSHINPWKLVSPTQACPEIPFAAGCDEQGNTDDGLINEAVRLAMQVQTAVVFAGLPDRYESEGFDRSSMSMPEGHVRLIEAVAAANPNTVVVLMCGSAVEMPWADHVKAILYMGLPGEAGGDAAADILFGRVNPSGKLAESWPYRYDDCICKDFYGMRDAHYREGVFVGYRYYASAGVPVRYPFGFGLSYTRFAYSDLRIDGDTVTCSVRNTGSMSGSEIAQLYIEPPKGDYCRPARELKGFVKVHLEPQEQTTVSFALNDRSFALWNDGWVIPGGKYTIRVGGSSEDLPLNGVIEKANNAPNAPALPEWYYTLKGVPSQADHEALIGHAIHPKLLKKGEFTMNNTIMEMKDHSALMRFVYWAMVKVLSARFGGKKAWEDATFLMMLHCAADASLSSMKINAGMNNHLLEGLLEMANGHVWRGLRTMLRGKR